MNYYERALELKEETIADRRYIHTNAEVGLHMPKAKAYVLEKLKEYGLDPKECGEGVTATLGKGGKVIMLRADMDALPMPEDSGLPFACPTGTEGHCCGHDLHAAMDNIQEEIELVGANASSIDAYAASDPAECFAVLSEYFFSAPELFAPRFPSLWQRFCQFYKQDPLQRLRNANGRDADSVPNVH